MQFPNRQQSRGRRKQCPALASQQGSGGKPRLLRGFTHLVLSSHTPLCFRAPDNPSFLLQSTSTTALPTGLTPSSDSPQDLCAPNLPGVMCSAPASYRLHVHGTNVGPPTLTEHFGQPQHLQTPSAGTVVAWQSTLCLTPISSLEIFKAFFFPASFCSCLKRDFSLSPYTLHPTPFPVPLPHTVLGQSLVVLLHSMSPTVQFSAGYQEARQREISFSIAESITL